MINVIHNKTIEWSVSDTFSLVVSDKAGFNEKDKLKFQISQSEDTEPIISNEYTLNGEVFDINLNSNDRSKLDLGYYIYRIIIIGADGSIVTQQSGDFIVKWGV